MNRDDRRRAGQRGPRQESYDWLQEVIGSFVGREISGGCDHCDAYQTVTPIMPGGWSVGIHHDDWCPWWAEYRKETA